MARHLNIDELPEVTEPVSFTLNGMKFEVKDFSSAMIDRVGEIERDLAGQSIEKIHAAQLAALTGQPTESFVGLGDVRKTAAALQFVMGAITEAGEAAAARKKSRR